MIQEPRIAIILVNWNGIVDTLRCLKSLQVVRYDHFQVVIVDNGSGQKDVEVLQGLKEVHVLYNNANLGFTGGNNVGIKWALDRDFEMILLLNNDTIVTEDFLQPLILELNNDSTGAVQPMICFQQDHDRIWHAGGRFDRVFGLASVLGKRVNAKAGPHRVKDVDWLTGCAFMLRADLIREVGLLDDNFFAYCEDVDYSLRLTALNYKLRYVPESVVYHEAGSSSRQEEGNKEGQVMPFIHYLNVRNRFFLIRQHLTFPASYLARVLQAFRSLLMIAYFLLRGRPQKLKAVIKGFRDGLFLNLKQQAIDT